EGRVLDLPVPPRAAGGAGRPRHSLTGGGVWRGEATRRGALLFAPDRRRRADRRVEGGRQRPAENAGGALAARQHPARPQCVGAAVAGHPRAVREDRPDPRGSRPRAVPAVRGQHGLGDRRGRLDGGRVRSHSRNPGSEVRQPGVERHAMSGPGFVVVRHRWRRRPGGGFVRLPGAYPLLGFDTFDEAEAIRDHREREVRERVNPFACGPSFFPLTHFAPHAFADWLRDVGLEPPEPDAPMPDWQTWWREVRPDMSVEQIQRCWQGLDKLRFFVVREVPDRPPVHVLLGIHWDNWEWTFVAEHEGGLPIAAYRDREVAGRAEAELREAR